MRFAKQILSRCGTLYVVNRDEAVIRCALPNESWRSRQQIVMDEVAVTEVGLDRSTALHLNAALTDPGDAMAMFNTSVAAGSNVMTPYDLARSAPCI